jgi:hypothetical protein
MTRLNANQLAAVLGVVNDTQRASDVVVEISGSQSSAWVELYDASNDDMLLQCSVDRDGTVSR